MRSDQSENETEQKSETERLLELLEMLDDATDNWEYLNGEERFGTVEEARHEIATLLENKVEWEVGVEDSDGNWEFYTSYKGNPDNARLDALQQAREDENLGDGLSTYQVNGPWEVA